MINSDFQFSIFQIGFQKFINFTFELEIEVIFYFCFQLNVLLNSLFNFLNWIGYQKFSIFSQSFEKIEKQISIFCNALKKIGKQFTILKNCEKTYKKNKKIINVFFWEVILKKKKNTKNWNELFGSIPNYPTHTKCPTPPKLFIFRKTSKKKAI